MSTSHSMDKRIINMLHTRTSRLQPGDSIQEPLVATSIYHLPAEPAPDRIYGRLTNPTVQAAEERLAVLEDAPTLLFASGMAAYHGVFMATLKAGDTVLLLSDGYYAVRHLMDAFLEQFDVRLQTCPARDISSVPLDGIKLVVIESPTNPLLDIIDIAALAKRSRAAGCLLAVDNTVCTALMQQPLDLGADIVLSADTKAASGHSDVLIGHVSSRDEALMERVHSARTLGGGIAGPFEAWLLLRGLETLDVRLERMCSNAQAVHAVLDNHRAVMSLHFPIEPHPQMSRSGFLISVNFADQKTAECFIENSGVFLPATSFGGLHSSADRRQRWGDEVDAGFLRLSIGCEPREQLVSAVQKALDSLT